MAVYIAESRKHNFANFLANKNKHYLWGGTRYIHLRCTCRQSQTFLAQYRQGVLLHVGSAFREDHGNLREFYVQSAQKVEPKAREAKGKSQKAWVN